MLAVDDAITVLAIAMSSAENVADNDHQQHEGYEDDCENHKRVEDDSRRPVGLICGNFGQIFPLIGIYNQRIAEARHAESFNYDFESIIVGGVGKLKAKLGHIPFVCDIVEGPFELIVINVTVGIVWRLPMKNDSIVGDDLGLGDGTGNCRGRKLTTN